MGEIVEFSKDIVQPIAANVRANPLMFRIGYGFNNLDKISDQQIIGQLLSVYVSSYSLNRTDVNSKIELLLLLAAMKVFDIVQP